MLGALYGDVIGSHYENHCTKDFGFPPERDSTFTDDSVLTAHPPSPRGHCGS